MDKSFKRLSDNELLVLLERDNILAYQELYTRYRGVLYIHAFKRLQDKEDCRDIIQNIFTTIWEKRKQLNIQDNLSGYLYTSVRNAIFNLLSKRRLKDEHVFSISRFADTWDASADHMTRENNLKYFINQEIEKLPPRTREIFKLSRLDHLTHKQIAEKLAISEQTVKTTVNNALKILRIKLGSIFFLFFL